MSRSLSICEGLSCSITRYLVHIILTNCEAPAQSQQMANWLLAVMMISGEKYGRGEIGTRDLAKRQLEKGREERGGVWGVWHIDRPGCVHLSPADKT